MIQTGCFRGCRGLTDCVSIARSNPKYYHGTTFLTLAPTWNMLGQYRRISKESGPEVAQKHYIIQYDEILSRLNPQKIYKILDGKILLCWEAPGDFCHRRLVAKWLENNLGIIVPEYGISQQATPLPKQLTFI